MRASDSISNVTQLRLNFIESFNNSSRNEQFEMRFITSKLDLTNKELAAALQCSIGHVRNIQRKYCIRRNDEQIKFIRSKLSDEQRGFRNPNWKNGISKNNYHYKLLQIERYPEKVKARQIVYNAIKSGKLKRSPCEICSDLKSEAHHEDYLKPLQIIWCCKEHHKILDSLLRRGFKFEETYLFKKRQKIVS